MTSKYLFLFKYRKNFTMQVILISFFNEEKNKIFFLIELDIITHTFVPYLIKRISQREIIEDEETGNKRESWNSIVIFKDGEKM